MQHVTDLKQLAAGVQIAVIGPWLECGIVAEVHDKTVTLLTDATGGQRERHLADMGVIPYRWGVMNEAYKTYLIDDQERTRLEDDCAEMIEAGAKAEAAAIEREERNQQHRDALTKNGTLPLSGAASLILGF